MLKLIPPIGDKWKLGLQKLIGSTLINQIIPLSGETSESLLPIVTQGYNEKIAVHKLGSGLSPDSESAGTLLLDFHDSRTVGKKKYLLFISHSFSGIPSSSPNDGGHKARYATIIPGFRFIDLFSHGHCLCNSTASVLTCVLPLY